MFRFIGSASAFTGAAQIRMEYNSQIGARLLVFNTDADRTPEMIIYVKGTPVITATDFIL